MYSDMILGNDLLLEYHFSLYSFRILSYGLEASQLLKVWIHFNISFSVMRELRNLLESEFLPLFLSIVPICCTLAVYICTIPLLYLLWPFSYFLSIHVVPRWCPRTCSIFLFFLGGALGHFFFIFIVFSLFPIVFICILKTGFKRKSVNFFLLDDILDHGVYHYRYPLC